MIADPLHLLECCLVTDGGGAVVIVRRTWRPGCRKPPVWILGTGEAVGYPGDGRDITTTRRGQVRDEAFGRAGVRPEEIDIAMIYDSFTITVLAILEDLGFAKKGEGGPLVEGGRLAFDQPGGPALNTDGGGLSSNHPGMRGHLPAHRGHPAAARRVHGPGSRRPPGGRARQRRAARHPARGRHVIVLGRDSNGRGSCSVRCRSSPSPTPRRSGRRPPSTG